MLWKSSLWKALWGHCHRRLKTKIKFSIFRQLQLYGTFQGLLQPFHYVLSTFVQNLRFYRYLHSGLQYDIISQPRNGKLSELTWRVKLSEFAMLSEAWTYFTLGTMVIFHFSQCNERTHQLSAFPGIAVYEQKGAKRCISSVQKCTKLHFGEIFQDVRYVGCPYNAWGRNYISRGNGIRKRDNEGVKVLNHKVILKLFVDGAIMSWRSIERWVALGVA